MSDFPPPLPYNSRGSDNSNPPPLPYGSSDRHRRSRSPVGDSSGSRQRKRRSRFDLKPSAKEVALSIAEKLNANTNPFGIAPGEIIEDLEVPDEIINDRSLNFIGLMIGPGGSTQRTMESQTQTKITVRGRGSTRDINTVIDPDRPMYVRIVGRERENVDAAVAVVQELLYDKSKRDALRERQMKQIGSGSLITATSKTGSQVSAKEAADAPPPASGESSLATTKEISENESVSLLLVPSTKVGLVIGKNAETLKLLQASTGTIIRVQREHSFEHPDSREVHIQGPPDQIKRAKELIDGYLTGRGERLPSGPLPQEDDFVMIPNKYVGVIIGRGGDTIKKLQADTSCVVQVTPEILSPEGSTERRIILNGTPEQCREAKRVIDDLLQRYIESGSDLFSFNQDLDANEPEVYGDQVELVSIPAECIDVLMGNNGDCVRDISLRTRTRIQINATKEAEQNNSVFPYQNYRTVTVQGDQSCIEAAKIEIQAVVDHSSKKEKSNFDYAAAYGSFGMDPPQYKLYIQQMQQYYGMNEAQVHEWYRQSMAQNPMYNSYQQQQSKGVQNIQQPQMMQQMPVQQQSVAVPGYQQPPPPADDTRSMNQTNGASNMPLNNANIRNQQYDPSVPSIDMNGRSGANIPPH